MHKSWVVTWILAVTCSLAEQIPLEVGILGTPCLAGIDTQRNTCKATGNSSSAFISHQVVEEDDCLSDDCDDIYQPLSKAKSTPWTHPKKCIWNEDSTQSFCVYTDSDFAHGRGISFFTNPTIAAHITTLPAFALPSVHAHINFSTSRPFEIRHVAGRGNGLFATRELHRGDLILADLPVGVYHSDAFRLDYEEDYKYLHVAFDQLPEETRELFMEMAAHYGGDELMERINTNGFHGMFEGAPHFLLYPETARMNHACRPNTMSYHDPETLIHATHASRTIHPGEEITLTYIDILQSRSARQNALSTYWGFTCTCFLCSATAGSITLSDSRIQEIQTRQTALRDWSSSSTGTPKMAEDLIRLFSEEQVYSAVATGYVLAALAHNAVGNSEMAKRYAGVAIEAGLVTGAVDGDVEDVKALLEDPELHWSFNKRRSGRR